MLEILTHQTIEIPRGYIYLDTFLPMPPSTNHLYFNKPGGRGRGLTQEGEAYKLSAITQIRSEYSYQPGGFWIPNPPARLAAQYTYYFPDYKVRGKLAIDERDLDNMVKVLQDSIFAAAQDDHHGYKPNDKQIYHKTLIKIKVTAELAKELAYLEHPTITPGSQRYAKGYVHAQLVLLDWGEGGEEQGHG